MTYLFFGSDLAELANMCNNVERSSGIPSENDQLTATRSSFNTLKDPNC